MKAEIDMVELTQEDIETAEQVLACFSAVFAGARLVARHRMAAVAERDAQIASLIEALHKVFNAETRAEVKIIARAELVKHEKRKTTNNDGS